MHPYPVSTKTRMRRSGMALKGYYETYISTIESQEACRPRLPQAYVDQAGPCDPESSPGQRPQAPDREEGFKVTTVSASTAPHSDDTQGQSLSFPRRCRLKSPLTIRDLSGRPTGRQRWDAFRLAWRNAGNAESDHLPRFAFVVSRQAGGAVRRNRTKRRLREAVRRNRALWPRGVDIVLRANGDRAARGTFAQLFDTVGRALRKIQIDSATKRGVATTER